MKHQLSEADFICHYGIIRVAVSEKKLPWRTSGKCAPFLPRIPLNTKIGTKGRLVIGDPRIPWQKLELVSKGSKNLPKIIHDLNSTGCSGRWWTFRYPNGKLIYLDWDCVAWLKKPQTSKKKKK